MNTIEIVNCSAKIQIEFELDNAVKCYIRRQKKPSILVAILTMVAVGTQVIRKAVHVAITSVCRTNTHIANLFDVDGSNLRKSVNTYKELLKIKNLAEEAKND